MKKDLTQRSLLPFNKQKYERNLNNGDDHFVRQVIVIFNKKDTIKCTVTKENVNNGFNYNTELSDR